jgi:hypothetical protein
LYTKAGSHSRYPEKAWFGERLDLPDQPTRREFAEACPINLVGYGEPRVDAGFSLKLEHGKSRPIYGCDTRSYYTFDYLLRPVEKVWANRFTLLDPGRRPQSVLYNDLRREKGMRYMLDFDDFNSQHELEAMRMVIEETCYGAPPDIVKWALESWYNMYVHWSDSSKHERKMVGTLPSGHRATTFVNTILNTAYCKYASADKMEGLRSFHSGDDVVVFGHSHRIDSFIKDIKSSPFRINPSKQSVGFECGEFLRVAFGPKAATGYAARGVSSLVSGNWVTDNRLDKKSYIETLLRGLWTIAGRFRERMIGCIAVQSIKRRVPELSEWALDLAMHRISFNGTPVSMASTGSGVIVMRTTGGESKRLRGLLKHRLATRDFLHNHIDFEQIEATNYTPGQIESIMHRASEKPREVLESQPLNVSFDESNKWYVMDMTELMTIHSRANRSEGEALSILQAMLTKVEWERLVGVVRGVVPTSYTVTGEMPWPVICGYAMPFSDCMSLRRRLTCTTAVLCRYPVRV